MRDHIDFWAGLILCVVFIVIMCVCATLGACYMTVLHWVGICNEPYCAKHSGRLA